MNWIKKLLRLKTEKQCAIHIVSHSYFKDLPRSGYFLGRTDGFIYGYVMNKMNAQDQKPVKHKSIEDIIMKTINKDFVYVKYHEPLNCG